MTRIRTQIDQRMSTFALYFLFENCIPAHVASILKRFSALNCLYLSSTTPRCTLVIARHWSWRFLSMREEKKRMRHLRFEIFQLIQLFVCLLPWLKHAVFLCQYVSYLATRGTQIIVDHNTQANSKKSILAVVFMADCQISMFP